MLSRAFIFQAPVASLAPDLYFGELTPRDLFGHAAVRPVDVGLQVVDPGTPLAAASDLEAPEFSASKKGPYAASLTFNTSAACSTVRKRGCLRGSSFMATSYVCHHPIFRAPATETYANRLATS